MRPWHKNTAGGALVILGLAGLGLPEARSQMYYTYSAGPAYPSFGYVASTPSLVRGYAPYAVRYSYPAPMQFGFITAHENDEDGAAVSMPAGERRASFYFVVPETSTRSGPAPKAKSPGVPTSSLPWQRPDFPGYDEPARVPAAAALGAPAKYSLETAALGRAATDRNVALVVVELPEDAALWVDGQLTRATGRTRYFESPPLAADAKYSYTMRAAWFEDGQWVSQKREVPIQAGEMAAVYLTLSPDALNKKKVEAHIESNLAKLDPRDREVARQQKTCAVREGARLGEYGVPVKVTVKDQPVFVCHEDHVREALANPDQIVAKVRDLRAKYSGETPRK
jgi:uncharacterized protein (TIGR03000 family)